MKIATRLVFALVLVAGTWASAQGPAPGPGPVSFPGPQAQGPSVN